MRPLPTSRMPLGVNQRDDGEWFADDVICRIWEPVQQGTVDSAMHVGKRAGVLLNATERSLILDWKLNPQDEPAAGLIRCDSSRASSSALISSLNGR